MDTNLDKFLAGHLPVNGPEMRPSQLSNEARRIVADRKKSADVDDLFSLIASFLNLKIKLYHAVLATILIGAGILLLNRQGGNAKKDEPRPSQYVSNIAAVKNSTVLSSCKTFVLHK
jgi:hypothetical protein